MKNLLKALRMFGRRECGVTAIEYGLLAALIAITITVGAALTGVNLNALFSSASDSVSDPVANAGKGIGNGNGNGAGGNGKGNGSGNGNSGGGGNGGPGTGIGKGG